MYSTLLKRVEEVRFSFSVAFLRNMLLLILEQHRGHGAIPTSMLILDVSYVAPFRDTVDIFCTLSYSRR